jgi:pyruvate decarboxylase
MEKSTQAVAALQTEINRLRHELQTLQVDQKSSDAEDTITVADYLLNRLAENGVTVRLDPGTTASWHFTDTLV